MLNGVPPYKALLTHGFVVDGQGRKMSKSLGNVIAPQKVSDTLGAEILRLWVGADRLLGRAVDLRRNPEARGRELSPHPQHAAFPARQHRRFRSRRRTRCRSTSGWRSTAMRGHALDLQRAAAERHDRIARTTTATSSTSSRRSCRRSAPRTSAASTSTFSRTGCTPPARTRARGARRRTRCITSRRPGAADGADPVVHRRGGVGDAQRRRRAACSRRPGIEFPAAARCGGTARALAEDARAARRGAEAARGAARRRQDRLSLQAEVELSRERRQATRCCSRCGDDLRFVLHHLAAPASDAAGRDGAADARRRRSSRSAPARTRKCERCWHYRADVGADAAHSGHLRALRRQSVRRRRSRAPTHARAGCALAAAGGRARPAVEVRGQRSCSAPAARVEVTPFFNLVLVHNRGAAFSFLAERGGLAARLLHRHRARRRRSWIVALLRAPSAARRCSASR